VRSIHDASACGLEPASGSSVANVPLRRSPRGPGRSYPVSACWASSAASARSVNSR